MPALSRSHKKTMPAMETEVKFYKNISFTPVYSLLNNIDQGCPTFCLLQVKFLSVSLSWATIAEIIKLMLSCKLVRKFVSKTDVL